MRVQVDERSERMNLKIREAQLNKVPYMLVIGDKEVNSSSVSLRLRSGDDLGSLPVAEFISRAKSVIETKATDKL
jgi:threonyl-tRNA synthetase